jgi:hypothetical protein
MSNTKDEVELNIAGQRFRFAGTLKLASRPGTHTMLTARCADCGAPFAQLAAGKTFTSEALTRRCEEHLRHARGARVTSIHPAALGAPPVLEVGDMYRLGAEGGLLDAQGNPGLDAVLHHSLRRRTITVRKLLSAIGDSWPGDRVVQLRLGVSMRRLNIAIFRGAKAGWIELVRTEAGEEFGLTNAARTAMAASKGVGHAG